jgi:hypothetical protein
MIKPAAPWVATGLVLLLVAPAAAWIALPAVAAVAAVAATVGAVVMSVGIYRLVQHADRAAGYRPAPAGRARISPEERTRQAAARAQLAREAGATGSAQE